MICEEVRGLISALQDGELSLELRGQVESHLKGCADCMAAYKANLRVSEQIRMKAPTYEVPESLRQRLPSSATHRPTWQPFGAGLSLGLAVCLAALVFLRPHESEFSRDLVSDHVRSLMATHLVDVVSSDRHTVKPWFLGKLDFAPIVPELRPDGYPLLGGRLDYVGGHTAAALVYGKQKHIINVLVLPEREAGSSADVADGYQVLHWRIGDLGYWAISDIPRDDLAAFGQAFQAAAK